MNYVFMLLQGNDADFLEETVGHFYDKTVECIISIYCLFILRLLNASEIDPLWTVTLLVLSVSIIFFCFCEIKVLFVFFNSELHEEQVFLCALCVVSKGTSWFIEGWTWLYLDKISIKLQDVIEFKYDLLLFYVLLYNRAETAWRLSLYSSTVIFLNDTVLLNPL